VKARGHRSFAHTADIGIRAWGPSLDDVFAEAVAGLVGITYDRRCIRPGETLAVRLEGEDEPALLVRLLSEVIYLADAEGFLTRRADVRLAGVVVEARLAGERYNADRHERVGPQVKAITYHLIEVNPGPPARARVIVDI
jgi:SHS2 domain-containing protein